MAVSVSPRIGLMLDGRLCCVASTWGDCIDLWIKGLGKYPEQG
jgi:hypothetical protein